MKINNGRIKHLEFRGHVDVLSRVSRIYLGLDNECPVSSNGNLLLHDAEAVEAADEQAGTV